MTDRLLYTVDDYIETGDSDPLSPLNYWVRALDEIYVDDGYWETGYTTAIKSVSAIASANITLSAVTTTFGTTLQSATSSISITGVRKRNFGASANSTTSISATNNRTRTTTADINGNTTATLSAVGKFVGETILTASCSISASVVKITPGSATLDNAGDETTWSNSNTWLEPRQEIWHKRVKARGNFIIRNNPASFGITASVSIAPNVYRFNSSIKAATSSVSVSGNRIQPGSASANISSSVSVPLVLSAKGGFATQFIVGSSTLSGAGILKVASGDWNASIQTSVSSAGVRPRTSSITANIQTTADYTANVQRGGSGVFNAATSSVITNRRFRFSSTLLAATTTLNSLGIRKKFGTATADSNTTVFINGGIRLGIADEILASIVSIDASGIFVRVDPYRTIDVLNESRTRIIHKEDRVLPVKSETRVNTIATENRNISVSPESRTWYIDRGTITVVSETPYDEERV